MSNTTKSDRTRQSKSTEPDLSPQQEQALVVLLAGGSDTQAAEAAGVTRQTVNGWRNHDDGFLARLRSERAAMYESYVDRLRNLVPAAIDVLAEGLQDDDPRQRLAVAMQVLKSAGLANIGRPTSEVTLEAVRAEKSKQFLSQAMATWGGPQSASRNQPGGPPPMPEVRSAKKNRPGLG